MADAVLADFSMCAGVIGQSGRRLFKELLV